MFDFLFKKRSESASTEVIQTSSNKDTPRSGQKFNIKQAELARAESLDGREEEALAFILESEFADARLQAFKHIHSETALTQVSLAMRNTDRRVSKLAQERLAQLQYQQKMHQEVQRCLLEGQQLLQRPYLTANQVSEWDKKRAGMGEYGDTLLQVKSELEHCLQQQIDLQREVIGIGKELHVILESALPINVLNEMLESCAQKLQYISGNPLSQSLPKNQLHQMNQDLAEVKKRLQQIGDADLLIGKRTAALTAWENDADLPVGKAKAEWQLLAVATSQCNARQQEQLAEQDNRVAVIFARFTQIKVALPHRKQSLSGDQEKNKNIDVDAALSAMEQALEEGSLQQALDIDKTLRQSDEQIRGDAAQRLAALRSELNRLADWAKWGVGVSREELIKVAEGLLSGDPAPADIAKQVGGLRLRWKELDRTGAASQALWERFDSACRAAYSVAETYFKQQAQLRAENLQAAQSQLAELDKVIAALPDTIADWKAHQNYIVEMTRAWRKIGVIDRKLKTRIEAEFEDKLARLNQPLALAQQAAIQLRRQLIQSISEINPLARDAVDQVKLLQQRWQHETTAAVLERKDEQALWHQFRAACDLIFSQRKSNAEQQKQRRHEAQSAKQAFCEQLELTVEKSETEIAAALRSARQEWRALSAQSHSLDARFDAIIRKLELKLVATQAEKSHRDKQNGLINLRARINLCQEIESAHQSEQISGRVQQWQGEWDQLVKEKSSLLTSTLSKLLTQRFSDAIKINRPVDANLVQENLRQFEERLLRVETLRNLPSPEGMAALRLQLQVRDLQSALKNRDAAENYFSNLYALCALPVALDTQSEQRFQAVLEDSIRG